MYGEPTCDFSKYSRIGHVHIRIFILMNTIAYLLFL